MNLILFSVSVMIEICHDYYLYRGVRVRATLKQPLELEKILRFAIFRYFYIFVRRRKLNRPQKDLFLKYESVFRRFI